MFVRDQPLAIRPSATYGRANPVVDLASTLQGSTRSMDCFFPPQSAKFFDRIQQLTTTPVLSAGGFYLYTTVDTRVYYRLHYSRLRSHRIRCFSGVDVWPARPTGSHENRGSHHAHGARQLRRLEGNPRPEMRINYGPGYRVYFTRRGAKVILLLCGGDKRTQAADIKRALQMVDELED